MKNMALLRYLRMEGVFQHLMLKMPVGDGSVGGPPGKEASNSKWLSRNPENLVDK